MDYESFEKQIDSSIEELTRNYNRKERRWMFDTQEEVEEVQKKIRDLKHQKQIKWESYLLTSKVSANLVQMLEPIQKRRDAGPNEDGKTFVFRDDEGYQPKHLIGFWSCPGCMMDVSKFPGQDELAVFRKQIEWCPKFVRALAHSHDPVDYEETIKRVNTDLPICYAGLFHSEFQVSATEAKLIKVCDTCGFSTTEVKQLAEPVDPEKFEVAATTPGNIGTVICTCKVCGEEIFNEQLEKISSDGGQTMKPEYEQMLNTHYEEKHPGHED